jgi:hypothetical protein
MTRQEIMPDENGHHTSNRSPGRATRAYNAGIRKTLIKSRVKRPLTMTRAKGL